MLVSLLLHAHYRYVAIAVALPADEELVPERALPLVGEGAAVLRDP